MLKEIYEIVIDNGKNELCDISLNDSYVTIQWLFISY